MAEVNSGVARQRLCVENAKIAREICGCIACATGDVTPRSCLAGEIFCVLMDESVRTKKRLYAVRQEVAEEAFRDAEWMVAVFLDVGMEIGLRSARIAALDRGVAVEWEHGQREAILEFMGDDRAQCLLVEDDQGLYEGEYAVHRLGAIARWLMKGGAPPRPQTMLETPSPPIPAR